MTTFGFHFIYALTLIHTLATLLGMQAFAYFGMFEKKKLPKLSIASLAGAYVGYIVLNNLNLQMNTVGFYQISKIAVAPAVSDRPQHKLITHFTYSYSSPSSGGNIQPKMLTAGADTMYRSRSSKLKCAGPGS